MFSLIDTIIVRPITNILFLIYNLVGDFGLAIILFVIVVKLCMWPLVKRQLHQTKLMRKIQPELAEIKKNCAGNRQLESLQTMDLYKKYNVKPFRAILALIIQLPMFIAIFGAIRVMVNIPTIDSNLDARAYSFVKQDGSRIQEVIRLQNKYLEEKSSYDAIQADESKTEEEKSSAETPVYEFHPNLFGIVNLEATPGFVSPSAIFALFLAVLACFVQYLTQKQIRPSGKSKGKSFRQLMKEAGEGKEVNQAEINDMTSAQMGTFMPIMLLLIMINLPGALILYYFLSNVITFVQQKIVLDKAEKEMEISADKAVLKELKHIQEAEVIENKKTGTKITRISAKDNKKKRR
ncbi:YidC/Oxa1 family membrane protein insertase [Candidatus Saccharibacteria bacterium]|nr:YidC/Oxa1 family membrane protein insertase [Candidatus Saccharibacteria bacterium]